jgi:hypothetical protein
VSPDGRPLGLPADLTVDLAADLSVEVDGVPVRVTASGSDVHVVADDVRGLLAGVRVAAGATTQGPPGRAELGRVAGTLADLGLTARLDGPGGRVLTMGAAVDSPTGSALLGTRHARLHPVGTLRAGGPGAWAGAAAVLGLAVVLLRRRRR